MSKPTRCVLVTGGTGIIGGCQIPALLERGMRVIALVRGVDGGGARDRLLDRFAKNADAMPPGALDRLTVVVGDTTLPSLGLATSALDGVTDLVHCAGSTAFKDDEPGWRANVVSAANVIACARLAPRPPRLIYVSTASVRIPTDGGTVHEDDALGGFTNGYIESKRAAEALFDAVTDLAVAIVRPSIVIGDGIDDKRMARSILWVIPAMAMLGDVPIDPRSRVDLVSVRFVASSLAALVARPALRFRRYHISAGPTASATCGEVVESLARRGQYVGRIRLHGEGPWPKRRRVTALEAQVREAMDFYVPFLNADVVYDRGRLGLELAEDLPPCPPVTDYVDRVLGLITVDEAVEESHRP